ncbi:MAG: hypothetical protein OEU68_08625 [Nitrospira sp.]|nr:hypothetical protein [Nitrospira sp.]MDH4244574.1 hypothetical protein [Nitrospira sp.]MDH4355867.1 hypothetical protein [Nitrospira sp.]MDH5319166.1 hypothetical protein [Nitrospira sp.]
MDDNVNEIINKIVADLDRLVRADTQQAVKLLETQIEDDIKRAADKLKAELSAIKRDR